METVGTSSSTSSFFPGDENVEQQHSYSAALLSPYIATSSPTHDVGDKYLDYLARGAQHRASSAFIQKLDSLQVLDATEAPQVKVMGPYVLGAKVGEGSFGKVKEGINSETLNRVAVKIVKRQRLKHIPDALSNTIKWGQLLLVLLMALARG